MKILVILQKRVMCGRGPSSRGAPGLAGRACTVSHRWHWTSSLAIYNGKHCHQRRSGRLQGQQETRTLPERQLSCCGERPDHYHRDHSGGCTRMHML